MYRKNRISILLNRIEEAISLIFRQTKMIKTSDDFLKTSDGVFTLSGVCMQLIFIGESVKAIDNKTNHEYLNKYPDIPWAEIMGLRDIIAHEYHRVDAEEIFQVIKENLPALLEVIKIMSDELSDFDFD